MQGNKFLQKTINIVDFMVIVNKTEAYMLRNIAL